MSRRAAIVEEEFDDDTDLPLPSHPLPNTGTIGPLLQELNISDDEFDPPPNQRAGPASPPSAQPTFRVPPGYDIKDSVTDLTPYKKFVRYSCTEITLMLLFAAGHASTQFISTPSAPTGLGSGAYRGSMPFGGHSARISQTRAPRWGLRCSMRSKSRIPATGRIPDGYGYSGRRTGGC
jgi:hypothetical protein